MFRLCCEMLQECFVNVNVSETGLGFAIVSNLFRSVSYYAFETDLYVSRKQYIMQLLSEWVKKQNTLLLIKKLMRSLRKSQMSSFWVPKLTILESFLVPLNIFASTDSQGEFKFDIVTISIPSKEKRTRLFHSSPSLG